MGFIPSFIPFIGSEELQSQRLECYKVLKNADRELTVREVQERLPMSLERSKVQTRLNKLAENGYVLKTPKRRCSVADHNQDVLTYYVPVGMPKVPEGATA